MKALQRIITRWKMKRELEARLRARKLLRRDRSQAAIKGWQTRRENLMGKNCG